MPPFEFRSTGAAAARGITDYFDRRDALKRQQLLDEIAAQQRAAAEQRQQQLLQIQQAQLKQQEIENTRAQQTQDFTLAQARAGSYAPGQPVAEGDVESLRRFYPGALDAEMGEPQPVLPGAPAMPGIMLPPTPTGRTTYQGTPAQRQTQQDRAAREKQLAAFLADPKTPEPVKRFIQAQQAAGDTSLPPQLFEPQKAPTPGSFEEYIGASPERRKVIEAARKGYGQADDRAININAGQAPEDVAAIVQGMIDGILPPQLPGRASPAYNAIMAEAQRRGFNLAGAATDWVATQQHTKTMNGAQQLRLNQAVNALPEMLDNVEKLAKQWNAGRFPALNKAHLALAKGGAYGTQAATIANQLDAQIADVVADLGNVYMGGNSPTDHALSLAGKSLSADWSEPVLRQMVALAKQNVQIRRNSINNTGVAGASADNPYAQQPPPQTQPPGGGGSSFRVVGKRPKP